MKLICKVGGKTYFDGKSANPERRPPHSDHLLGESICFLFLFCFGFFPENCVNINMGKGRRDAPAQKLDITTLATL